MIYMHVQSVWSLTRHIFYFCLINELLIVLFFCRVCYFKTKQALSGGISKFLDDLNKSYGSGVLTSDFEPHEFKSFLKWLIKNYFRYTDCIEKGDI